MKPILLINFLVLILLAGCSSTPAPKTPAISRLAFGSCNHQNAEKQPLWDVMASLKPDVFAWTGDAVYVSSADPKVVSKAYELQKNNADYQRFLKTSNTQVIGTWDDNDYGQNNGGRWFEGKASNQQIFLDFLDEPKTSPRRKQAGVYSAYTYGPEGQQIKVYLLDIRYHRDKVEEDGSGDILGEEQWQWLETELRNSKAQVNIIASGIQVIPKDHPFEKWNLHPKARARLFELLKSTKAPGVLLISGDRHIAEFSKIPAAELKTQNPLFEMTASGMTHSYDSFKNEENRYRVGKVFAKKNFGFVVVDWSKTPATITAEIRNENGKVQDSISFSALPL